jgi:hypothetical protein
MCQVADISCLKSGTNEEGNGIIIICNIEKLKCIKVHDQFRVHLSLKRMVNGVRLVGAHTLCYQIQCKFKVQVQKFGVRVYVPYSISIFKKFLDMSESKSRTQ